MFNGNWITVVNIAELDESDSGCTLRKIVGNDDQQSQWENGDFRPL